MKVQMKAFINVDENGKIIGVQVNTMVTDESIYDYIFNLHSFVDPVEILENWEIVDGQLVNPYIR